MSDRNIKSKIADDQIETETSVNSGSLVATPQQHISQKSPSRINFSRIKSSPENSSNGTPTIIPETSIPSSTKLKVRTDRSAMVLVTIVILFVLTHSYRIALKVYEVASPNAHTIEKFKICFALKR